MKKETISVFWFRRDLRIEDNHGLYQALISGRNVLPIFIFDTTILSKLNPPNDLRISFIYKVLESIDQQFRQIGSGIRFFYGTPTESFVQLLSEYHIEAVYTNEDYEPDALARDTEIATLLNLHGATLHTYKDQVIFAKNDILKSDGTPYTVYTPYSKRWITNFYQNKITYFPSENHLDSLLRFTKKNISLPDIGFQIDDSIFQPPTIPTSVLSDYHLNRDIPHLDATSRMSVHLRFGTISIRFLVNQAAQINEIYMKELIWREFFMQIMYHFPHVAVKNFKSAYNRIEWGNNEMWFDRWCQGLTGFPIVDAGMRELNRTGFMHNRVRMIVASFLVKDLQIDWRWGEAYFAEKLLDYELAINNGNWQWAAGTGCDAAPYFRIFNPDNQQKKFDPNGIYIRRWLPEWNTPEYPNPIVDHKTARELTLKMYGKIREF